MAEPLSVSVVVPTYRRPQYVRQCLEHLGRLRTAPLEVLVVDASPDEETRAVVDAFPGVRYLRNELGAGSTPESRGIGVDAARGDVVAFVDDDAYVDEEWLDEITGPYADARVVGVGGRIVNGDPGEERRGLNRIGRLLPDGRLLGNFTADPGRVVAVDHFLGANMSFRRRAILDVGGVHGGYPAPCVCEESDIALRQRALGRRLVFNPRAVVRHVSAPYSIRGDRFDRRWHFIACRNQAAMLVRIFGPASGYPRAYAITTARRSGRSIRAALRDLVRSRPHAGSVRKLGGSVSRAAIELSGVAVGLVAGVRARRAERPSGAD
ncbi:Glycosyltransferases, probably involved in cell wall biogenesis [Cellulosimicrobium cellulans J34]|nr:Glycosyltransferases, probably involved in cell wall biogenesis [Cellulosimicrobium cellulans J34]SMF26497.1 Glycosyltransferases, probably involved in cell wall biogenesis [Cellulosimicrobium cellulans J1]